ncbi:MogA/MoaB family molybdenum cofactor biosynthesis protein [Oscillatoria sp. FACHB-1406]|uniref:MogA/MoaB family molybdenum cofactor biosynthesis protein n=1 Tax=Oscillatoria sp. FACHB-1406 TaxID=2692846 RepID=UPI001688CB20|nr:MogA/MoaB family molybdenum cofactor biosynthesis protein [Oscillatoria sp. FACHB-1406]MBD2579659.1 MogA/MoaB family molybdenum cofactor biosynthesis protein [Oscillatoria sp. FACHB-1406]
MSDNSIPHPDEPNRTVGCAIITVSDTRTLETDRSGRILQTLLLEAQHRVVAREIIPDEPARIQELFVQWCKRDEVEVLIFNGGTGIAPRDTTYDAIATLLEKTLPGFGELFRFLSYQEIGSRAIASRAIAGTYRNKPIFSLPGSTAAVTLAMKRLILPELVHLVGQLNPPTRDD